MTPKFYLFHLILRYKIVVAAVTVILVLFFTQASKQYYLVSQQYSHEPIDVVYTWVNGSDPRFLTGLRKVLQTNSSFVTVDSSPQRFDDKYELKFSLRSLEKFAPWIRHIYIVTNGQIPYWLNLDYEKVTVISHTEIFDDPSDLPTFSSPAIEAHLHRIPGISERFIYFNDDIFLGAPVFLEDFFSENRGHLVYLTWPVPPCAVDCPWMYVNDGQCDNQCYSAACQMDGRDCDNEIKDKNGNLVKTPENQIEPDFQAEENLNDPSHLKHNRSSQLPKPPRITDILKKNTTDLTQAILQHNRKVMDDNKRRRKKLKYRRGKYSERTKPIEKRSDAFGQSLQHTNRMLNARYGFKTRYVAAHAPILIDTAVMGRLQGAFSAEFAKTSANKLRSVDDVQYAFAYYYFLMQEKVDVDAGTMFDVFDTDGSGTWSDREIRTILTKLYELPLSYAVVDHFESILTNCSSSANFPDVNTPEFERYIDSKLPTITRAMVVKCHTLNDILRVNFGKKQRYKFEVITNAHSHDVTFKMLTSNISEVVGHLDEIRKKTSKFVCLNDNLEDGKDEDNDLVKSVLYDFYLSLFPRPSGFELPPEFRNRFLYVDELADWKRFHFRLKLVLLVVFLMFLYVCTFRLYSKGTKCGVFSK